MNRASLEKGILWGSNQGVKTIKHSETDCNKMKIRHACLVFWWGLALEPFLQVFKTASPFQADRPQTKNPFLTGFQPHPRAQQDINLNLTRHQTRLHPTV